MFQRESDFQREIKVCKTSLIHANSAITLKCKSRYLSDEVEKPILFLPVIDGNLYGFLQIHESFEQIKKDRISYITLTIYNPSSEPYYIRKGALTCNECIIIPLESERKTLHITEPDMKVKKKRQSRKLRLDTKFRFKSFMSHQTKNCKGNIKLSKRSFFLKR